jgi:hypothetical protein
VDGEPVFEQDNPKILVIRFHNSRPPAQSSILLPGFVLRAADDPFYPFIQNLNPIRSNSRSPEVMSSFQQGLMDSDLSEESGQFHARIGRAHEGLAD